MKDISALVNKFINENDSSAASKILNTCLSRGSAGSEEDEILAVLLKHILKPFFREIDADELIYEINFVRGTGVIENLEQAEFLKSQLEITKLKSPFLENCIREVKFRKDFSEKFVSQQQFLWPEEKKMAFLQALSAETDARSYDQASKIVYLQGKFVGVRNDLRRKELNFEDSFNNELKRLFDHERFIATPDELSSFIYDCEIEKGTINSIYDIIRSIKKINDTKIELQLLKKELEILLPTERPDQSLTSKGPEISVEPKYESSTNAKINNPYPHVFVSRKGFLLFDRLYHSKKDSPTPLAEFSFIYRRMWKDNLLREFQRPEVFRKWLAEEEKYALVLPNAIKRLAEIGHQPIKEEAYQSAKELIKE